MSRLSEEMRIEYRKGGRAQSRSFTMKGGDFGDFSVMSERRISDGRERISLRFGIKSDIELIRLDYLSMDIGEAGYIILGGLKYLEKGERRSALPEARISFPFDRYYSQRIEPIKTREGPFVSSIYLKMPVAIMEYDGSYISVSHRPIITSQKGERLLSFLHLSDRLILSIFGEYPYLYKETTWMGIPERMRKKGPLKAGDSFEISIEILRGKGGWKEAVRALMEQELADEGVEIRGDHRIKRAFRRCYNHRMGCFMQLPYKMAPGFLFSGQSYNLMAYEALRLNVFHRAWKLTGDEEYLRWARSLKSLLSEERFWKKLPIGRVWHNSSVSDGKKLRAFTYLGDTYGAYPGGQAEIAMNLMEYSIESGDGAFEGAIKETLEYILNTQNPDGSWPMARRDTLIFVRPGITGRRSVGNTTACVRALSMAYRIYRDGRYMESAERGALWMNRGHPLGYNAVLDAGIDEVEGLSAIYAIDANVEMFRATGDIEYLRKAEEWALHALTWVHLWDSPELDIKWTMGPFSTSITPRVSPYETVKLSNSIHALHELTDDPFWKRVSDVLLKRAMDFRERDGGLSEAFSITEHGLREIPVEQCFASTELLRAYLRHDMEHSERKVDIEAREVDVSGRRVTVDGEEVMGVLENGMIRLFEWVHMGFSFYDVYSRKQRRMVKARKILRKLGKISLICEVPKILRGYRHPPAEKGLSPWENVEKSVDMHMGRMEVEVRFETRYHSIKVRSLFGKDRILMHIDVRVLEEDLDMARHILIPYFKAKGDFKTRNGRISIGKKGEEVEIISLDGMGVSAFKGAVGFDATLESNWTHGGVFSTDILVKRNKH